MSNNAFYDGFVKLNQLEPTSFICGPFTSGVIRRIFAENKSVYNPVLFCGNVRKTSHICKAIADHFIELERRVSWVTAEEFTRMLIDALILRKMNDFRSMFFPCDVLIIENVETLSGRLSTQEEFYYLFDRVYESGAQIILSSRIPPMKIISLEDRVRTQLQAGICCYVDE